MASAARRGEGGASVSLAPRSGERVPREARRVRGNGRTRPLIRLTIFAALRRFATFSPRRAGRRKAKKVATDRGGWSAAASPVGDGEGWGRDRDRELFASFVSAR